MKITVKRAAKALFGQRWRVTVQAGGNHEHLFKSSERYRDRADAKHAAELLKRDAATAEIIVED